MAANTKQNILAEIDVSEALTQEQAALIYQMGEEAVVFILLKLSKAAAQKNNLPLAICSDPSTPSAQKPVFAKENSRAKRSKKPGRKPGHEGVRRGIPQRIDHVLEHRAEHCPDCGGQLQRRSAVRRRIIEDIPDNTSVEATEHIIHRDYCPKCKKTIEPVVTQALANSSIGSGILVLSAWLHYALGNTISQILDVFNFHLRFEISSGGLVQMWHRLSEILQKWYDEIMTDVQKSGVLHGDETGWRVNGKTHWLWCFTTINSTVFTIEHSRGSPVVLEFIKECFTGVLVSDFWYAYNVLTCAKQKCLVHLLRDLERVDKYKDCGQDWPDFRKKLKRMLKDAIRLRKRKEVLSELAYDRRREYLERRLGELIGSDWSNKDARRLVKRLRRHQDEMFTFLHNTDVPFDNNFAERNIRGAVIMRKNSYNNRSDKGAMTQSILMSVLFTIKQRGHNPVSVIKNALTRYLQTGTLPRLADMTETNG